jgi:DNA-binding NtrC family response regulator
VTDLTTVTPARDVTDPPRGASRWALTVLFSAAQPERVGEVAPIEEAVLGRHGTLRWARRRPGQVTETGSLQDPALSRVQLRFGFDGARPEVHNAGRQPLRLNRRPVESAPLSEGDVLEVGDRLVVLVSRRPERMPSVVAAHGFGEPDRFGIVGESVAAWRLRERLAFVGPRKAHVLVLGESGTGKELAARAVHGLSRRASGPWVARSAATIPPTLADAELFGNLADYPNTGAPERPGLIGAADGGSLFLDEIGKLPPDVQVRLLRVLDDGEYSRLGDARARVADLRLIAASNRDPASLEHDVRARMPLEVQLPGLGERRADIPLLARHLARAIVADDPGLAARFFDGDEPRFSAAFVVHLVERAWRTHVRELDALIWRSFAESVRDQLEVPAPRGAEREAPVVVPGELTPDVIQACLDRHDGAQEPVWRELGLSSRHALARLVRKHGLKVRGRGRARPE